ncbi:acyl-CoA synthetase (AMP-forming)/AMP-acid ligase II [Actinoplanes octamycinicus]|uniref:Acyl-CoA synthetase (AMP-forming)/AMP-acid ligase II n=1 Tax=Actinoplanes octamycinicus TaxID=135948 RepID=A0A7W7GXC0_9ACTN|nr:class I adenylate-forming enzyme family protein [Actinoplanes octamycinicus]MBB4740045.1 acyl-CoA synthetase (AMP-forming)/AMP-acid ligase II [Actinoplanes octamycinicus]GIE59440.1 fatty-acyl-CoA synthase [Actinoplanes octamycinicus]
MLDDLIAGLRPGDDTPALLGRRRVSRGDVAHLLSRYAGALHAHGLRPGDTLGIAVRPGARALAVLLAAYRNGLRVAVLDPSAGPDVLRARLGLAKPALIVADAAAQAVATWAAPLARRAGLALPDLTELAPTVTVGRRLPGSAPALAAGGPPPPAYDGDGDAVVIFTSGTTASPRAVVHTRSGLATGMRSVAELVQPRAGVPILGGMFFVLVPSLAAGAPVAMPSRRARTLGRQVTTLRPQATYLTPPQLRAALDAGVPFHGRVYSGSAPVSATLLNRVRAAGADQAWCVYALTEVFPAAAVEATEKAAHTGDGDLVGELLPGVRADLSPTGELRLAGAGVCDRYLGADPHPWVSTGDIARLDGRRVVLAGRAKDMILRRAENIYPGLYEPSLHVPGVALAVLVGVPAGDGDEDVVAIVETTPGADPAAVRAALREPLRRMGAARPDRVLFAPVPLAGRSRKPDRAAAAHLAATHAAFADPASSWTGR